MKVLRKIEVKGYVCVCLSKALGEAKRPVVETPTPAEESLKAATPTELEPVRLPDSSVTTDALLLVFFRSRHVY